MVLYVCLDSRNRLHAQHNHDYLDHQIFARRRGKLLVMFSKSYNLNVHVYFYECIDHHSYCIKAIKQIN